MVNRSTIAEILATLDGFVQEIQAYRALPRERVVGDSTVQYAVRYVLQSAIQCVLDLGLHILVDSNLDRPHDSKEVIRALGRHAVISPELAARIEGMAGFRNILVHRYFKVDADLVHRNLQDGAGDFAAFTQAIRIWLAKQP